VKKGKKIPRRIRGGGEDQDEPGLFEKKKGRQVPRRGTIKNKKRKGIGKMKGKLTGGVFNQVGRGGNLR